MSNFLIAVGFVFLIIGIITKAGNTNTKSKPSHGDIQIRQKGGDFWLYKYRDRPGWTLFERCNSLEDARKRKAESSVFKEPETIVE